MKKDYIEDIVQYLKITAKENKELLKEIILDSKKMYPLAKLAYKELRYICRDLNYDKKLNIFFDEYYEEKDETMMLGSLVHLCREHSYFTDIKIFEIKSLYPHLISLIHHNTNNTNDLFYVYMVDNMELIKSKLNKKQNILFRSLINYYFGYLVRFDNKLANEVVSMARKIMESIIEDDRYLDVLYIDTDSIYIKNTIETSKYIEDKLKIFFDYYEENYYAVFFNRKKSYILFDKEPFKMKGLQETTLYQDKQLSNIAFDLSKTTKPFNEFRRKKQDNIEYWIQAKRLKKLNRIMED